jgi:hypothetical protein
MIGSGFPVVVKPELESMLVMETSMDGTVSSEGFTVPSPCGQ